MLHVTGTPTEKPYILHAGSSFQVGLGTEGAAIVKNLALSLQTTQQAIYR